MSSRLVDTERGNAQYSRRETLEIVGLPKSLTNDKAETKMCQVFWSLDCNVNKKDLDACRWLKDKELLQSFVQGRTLRKFRKLRTTYGSLMQKFCPRKDCEKVLKAKNDLRKLDSTNLDLPQGCKVFVNQSLCCYYCLFWSASKQLHGKGRIFGWYDSNESIKIKLQENGLPLYISHIEDFKKYFPDTDFHSF